MNLDSRSDIDGLRETERPNFEHGHSSATTVDLFCGCGGMSLGIAQACHIYGLAHEVAFALDNASSATSVYEANFPTASVHTGDIRSWFASDFAAPVTEDEERLAESIGHPKFLVGGPPCQGNSNLNNHTRRMDPRNELYFLMSRAARILEPDYVIVENVPNVASGREGMVDATKKALSELGYSVTDAIIDISRIGLPQTRKRHVLLATNVSEIDPSEVFFGIYQQTNDASPTVEHAIGDLTDIAVRRGFDAPSVPSSENARRIAHLFENDLYELPNDQRPACHRDKIHTYNAVYGRLWWNRPSPTVTTGFNSTGQGRNVHPSERRTITPHEAARLQYFPDYFDFSAVATRTAWATLIGNAVPPLLTRRLALTIFDLEGFRRDAEPDSQRSNVDPGVEEHDEDVERLAVF